MNQLTILIAFSVSLALSSVSFGNLLTTNDEQMSFPEHLLGEGLKEAAEAIKRKDHKTALRILKPLAESGNPVAQFNLGVSYRRGAGVAKNDVLGVQWYTKAAKQGHTIAQFNLGTIYYQGSGVPKNRSTAVKWFTLAAKDGNHGAQKVLRVMNAVALDNARKGDFENALSLWKPLAENGHTNGQMNLGHMYSNGDGVEKDLEAAFSWYLKAAKQDILHGQFMVGTMYIDGHGIKKNLKEGLNWIGRAARKGHSDSQLRLASLFILGEEVKTNITNALFWLYAAHFEGNAGAQELIKPIEKEIPKEKLDTIKKHVRECVNNKYKDCFPKAPAQ